MRSCGSRLRECGRRGGCLAASLIALAACGDNQAAQGRLAPARYVWDDGTEQIDHHTLYDRTLESLCTPTLFSDGATYCLPPADDGFYIDDHCTTAVARVPSGQAPKPFVATMFGLAGAPSVSRVYRAGALTDVPQQRWERRDNLCVAMPIDDGFDYYAAGPQIMDLAQLHDGVSDDYDAWQVKRIVGDGVNLPWSFVDSIYGDCSIADRPSSLRTWCHPAAAAPISYYATSDCTMPVITAPAKPPLAYVPGGDCASYYSVGLELVVGTLFQYIDRTCIPGTLTGPTLEFTVGASIMLPELRREQSGPGRLKALTLTPTLMTDDFMFDTGLGVNCRRDDQGRCVPAATVPVETWFADATCSQPIELAMVPITCAPEVQYARKGDAFFHIVTDRYSQPLYQLDTGDTCSPYVPRNGYPHSLGPPVSDTALARATLTIE